MFCQYKMLELSFPDYVILEGVDNRTNNHPSNLKWPHRKDHFLSTRSFELTLFSFWGCPRLPSQDNQVCLWIWRNWPCKGIITYPTPIGKALKSCFLPQWPWWVFFLFMSGLRSYRYAIFISVNTGNQKTDLRKNRTYREAIAGDHNYEKDNSRDRIWNYRRNDGIIFDFDRKYESGKY